MISKTSNLGTRTVFAAHASTLALVGNVRPHYIDKAVTLETLGRVLQGAFIPAGIQVIKLAFYQKAVSLGYGGRSWVQETLDALQAQYDMGLEQAKKTYKPFHIVMKTIVDDVDASIETASTVLRTIASIAELSIVPKDSIQTLYDSISAKATKFGVVDKPWIALPLSTLLAQQEIAAGAFQGEAMSLIEPSSTKPTTANGKTDELVDPAMMIARGASAMQSNDGVTG